MMRRQDQAAPARLFVVACSIIATGFILFAQSIFGDRLMPQVQIEASIIEVNDRGRFTGIGKHLVQTLAELPAPPQNSFPIGKDFGLGRPPLEDVVLARFFPDNKAPGTLNLSA